jgi:surface antigen
MNRINNKVHVLLAALAVAGMTLPVRAPTALADTGTTLAQLNQQLTSDEARLTDLNDRVERADADVDGLVRKVAADQQREADLAHQMATLARLEYEQPVLTLSRVLEARSLDQLMSDTAQARLVARKQQGILGQARTLRAQDQQAHDQMASRAADVRAARDQAAQIAARTMALRDATSDSGLIARAQSVAGQAQAGLISASSGPNHFSFGYCTWYVANRRYIPWFGNANEWWANARPYGFAEGQTPVVGAVMVTNESSFGHVAYVESVAPDGSWTVSEMNFVAWDVVSRRTLHRGQAPVVGFIYGKP